MNPYGMIVIAYVIGSIPTGYWLGKVWKGIDVRQHGSGNLGATNVLRVLGPVPGGFTLAFDIFKGFLAVCLMRKYGINSEPWAVAAGVVAILGHTTSFFVRFRGGKGVATSLGVFAALLPWPALFAVIAFIISLLLTRRVSVGSIAGVLTLSISAFVRHEHPLLAYTSAAIAAMVLWTHRANIQRLLAGTEPRIGQHAS
jgi:glycerol-3-phosphate acyltransferase PlsY